MKKEPNEIATANASFYISFAEKPLGVVTAARRALPRSQTRLQEPCIVAHLPRQRVGAVRVKPTVREWCIPGVLLPRFTSARVSHVVRPTQSAEQRAA